MCLHSPLHSWNSMLQIWRTPSHLEIHHHHGMLKMLLFLPYTRQAVLWLDLFCLTLIIAQPCLQYGIEMEKPLHCFTYPRPYCPFRLTRPSNSRPILAVPLLNCPSYELYRHQIIMTSFNCTSKTLEINHSLQWRRQHAKRVGVRTMFALQD